MSDKLITDALGLRPLDEVLAKPSDENTIVLSPGQYEITNETPAPSSDLNDEVVSDIEKAKENIDEILQLGKQSLDTLVQLADQSQSPRAFEVVSTMMKTLIDANKELVLMSEKKKFAKEDHPAAQTQNNVTNNNLILSTTDLLKMIKGEQ